MNVFGYNIKLEKGGYMKKEIFEKKLQLNKTTLTNLDHSDMTKVKGGSQTIDKICAIKSEGTACTWIPICVGTYYC